MSRLLEMLFGLPVISIPLLVRLGILVSDKPEHLQPFGIPSGRVGHPALSPLVETLVLGHGREMPCPFEMCLGIAVVLVPDSPGGRFLVPDVVQLLHPLLIFFAVGPYPIIRPAVEPPVLARAGKMAGLLEMRFRFGVVSHPDILPGRILVADGFEQGHPGTFEFGIRTCPFVSPIVDGLVFGNGWEVPVRSKCSFAMR